MSDVYVSFLNLPLKFETEEAMSNLTEIEINYIQELTRSRFQFIYGDAHGLGYLLDPRYIGEKLEPKLRDELEVFIVNSPLNNEMASEENQRLIFRQFTDVLISSNNQKTRNSFQCQMLVQEQKSPLEFWLTDGTKWPILQKLAKKVFSLAVASALSERNF